MNAVQVYLTVLIPLGIVVGCFMAVHENEDKYFWSRIFRIVVWFPIIGRIYNWW